MMRTQNSRYFHNERHAERNWKLFEAVLSGQTCADAGAQVGLSESRTADIVARRLRGLEYFIEHSVRNGMLLKWSGIKPAKDHAGYLCQWAVVWRKTLEKQT